ncbi:phage tail sheath family protein [Clostridium sp. CX1]|uniref:phage tail sheath family protein n=1 Tax=Clostridium sp. CX1 TaxID=2978346 RepID=UPI0021C0B0DD|nr:phage tail sheath family protein [Clostridium sp. CX1]MCT8975495.1 phage tail sheath family protein [Clostridium sp. CX1]
MTDYKHGVYASEVVTSIASAAQATAGLQVVVGTAPINLAETREYVSKPLLAYKYSEAVKALGYSDDWESYTLCEAMNTAFMLYGVGPVVFINVLDPSKHITEVSSSSVPILNHRSVITDRGVLLDTLKVKIATSDGQELIKNTDYTATFDGDGNVIITAITGGSIPLEQGTLSVSYTKIDPSKVTDNDIIGGVDANTGASTGLELINSIFPKFGLVPGTIIAPKYSKKPTIEAVMKAKASSVNTYFKACTAVDIDTLEANTYTKVSGWKNEGNYISENEFVCWPKLAFNNKIYNFSTHLASLMNLVDSKNDDTPHKSPSNEPLKIDKAITKDGTEVNLGPDQAAYLNGEGIVTALNFMGNWRAWGNRTGAYPSNKNTKDAFIPVRRMHNWVQNTIILRTWQKVDNLINKMLISSVVDEINIWLNGLTSAGALIGGRVEFLKEENPTTDLLDGIVRYHVYLAEPTPAREIDFIVEFDATYYNQMFSE